MLYNLGRINTYLFSYSIVKANNIQGIKKTMDFLVVYGFLKPKRETASGREVARFEGSKNIKKEWTAKDFRLF